MIKNIVFDFGGVIADIDREQAVQAFIRLGVKDADRILDKYHQTGIFQELEEGTLTEEAYRNELGKLCGRTLSWEEVQQAWLGFFTGIDVRKLHYLETLRREGYKLYVLSNTNPYVMGWACSERFSSEGKPLTAYFEKLYLSYQIGCTKPDRRILSSCLPIAKCNRKRPCLWTTAHRTLQPDANWVCIRFNPKTEATGATNWPSCSSD